MKAFFAFLNHDKAYKCLKLKDSTIIISRHVHFYEDVCPFNDYKIDTLKKEITTQITHLPIPTNKNIIRGSNNRNTSTSST